MADEVPVAQDKESRQPQEPSRPGPVDLTYPQILLQASFVSLLSSSFPSTTQSQAMTMPTSERSLSESWASLSEADYTPESDYTPEDDSRSEATDIVSLLDTNASEDMQSNEEHRDTQQLGVDEQQAPAGVEEPAELPTPMQASVAQLQVPGPYDSTLTIGAPSPNAIRFEESDRWPMTGRVDLMHSVKIFDEKEKAYLARSIPKVHRAVQLNGTIRMTIDRDCIRRDRPFRLLYSGSTQATETRAEILKKVGDVLVASSNVHVGYDMDASRYHVIPSEFGPGSAPNYAELIPLQFQQMIVDECVAAAAFKQDSSHSQIQLEYKAGQSLLSSWDGAAYRVPKSSGWDPPDLAIIFVRESDDASRQLFSGRLNEFTSRHHIPTLVVRDDNDWSTLYDYIIPDRRSLHMCVEARATGILQLLPIDLSSFINLDASQLNKHIACLCSIYDSDAGRQEKALKIKHVQEPRETLADVEKNLSMSIVAQNRTKAFLVKYEDSICMAWQISVGLLLLILGVSFCRELLVLLAAYFGGSMSMTSIAPSTTAQPTQPVVSMITATDMIPTAIASVSTASLQVIPSVAGLTAPIEDEDLARLISDAAVIYNTSDNFQVQILGDGHVVVKVPQKLVGRKKVVKVKITVMRGSVEVPSNTSKLFDGLYTVKIDRERANGLLNFTLTVTKPSITETHELDFGKSWVPAQTLKEALNHIWQPLRDQMGFSEQSPRVIFGSALAAVQGRLQFASIGGMALVNNLTAQYGPSFRRVSQDAQSRSQDFYAEAVRHAKVAAEVAHREARDELQQFSAMSQIAGRRVFRFTHKLFKDVSSGMTYVRDRATSIDLEDVRDKIVRSENLAEAQERAQKIVEDVKKKLKTRQKQVTVKKAERKKSRAERKFRKREGKKAWHDNVRVNLGRFNIRL